jgi:hypothetical protein
VIINNEALGRRVSAGSADRLPKKSRDRANERSAAVNLPG